MKKGFENSILAIILGIIVILVIIAVFGVPLVKYLQGLFSAKGLFAPKTP